MRPRYMVFTAMLMLTSCMLSGCRGSEQESTMPTLRHVEYTTSVNTYTGTTVEFYYSSQAETILPDSPAVTADENRISAEIAAGIGKIAAETGDTAVIMTTVGSEYSDDTAEESGMDGSAAEGLAETDSSDWSESAPENNDYNIYSTQTAYKSEAYADTADTANSFSVTADIPEIS